MLRQAVHILYKIANLKGIKFKSVNIEHSTAKSWDLNTLNIGSRDPLNTPLTPDLEHYIVFATKSKSVSKQQ